MTAVAVKSKSEETPIKTGGTYNHRRFGLPDLQDMGIWLIGRLKQKHPHAQDRELMSWLRNAAGTGGNDYLFMRTDHAVALAQVYRESLAPFPVVQEWFVLVQDKEFCDEGAYLYAVMFEWGRSLGADELRIERYTDVPRETIKTRLGKLFLRDLIYAKLDRVIG